MNSWEQASFTAVEIHNSIENKVFFVPPYQRGCVWSSKQKDQFVDTLKRGLEMEVTELCFYLNIQELGIFQMKTESLTPYLMKIAISSLTFKD